MVWERIPPKDRNPVVVNVPLGTDGFDATKGRIVPKNYRGGVDTSPVITTTTTTTTTTSFTTTSSGAPVEKIVDFVGWTEVDPNNLILIFNSKSIWTEPQFGQSQAGPAYYTKDFGAGHFNDRLQFQCDMEQVSLVPLGNGGVFYFAFCDNTTPLSTPNNAILIAHQVYTTDGWTTMNLLMQSVEYVGGVLQGTNATIDWNTTSPSAQRWYEIDINPHTGLITLTLYTDSGFSVVHLQDSAPFNVPTWSMRYVYFDFINYTVDTNDNWSWVMKSMDLFHWE